MPINILKSCLMIVMIFYGYQANALKITVTKMEFYPPGATSPSVINNSDGGVIDFDAGTGTFKSGPNPSDKFFGFPWTATVQTVFTIPGSYRWSGVAPMGPYDYPFTLKAGQVAAGLFFEWSGNVGIPVLAVFECDSSLQCLPVNTDGDTAPGTAMQTPPFPTQTPAFSGVSDIDISVFVPPCANVLCTSSGTFTSGPIDSDGDGRVSLDQVISSGIPLDKEAYRMCVGGCFDFSAGVPSAGDELTIILRLTEGVPPAARYRKWNGSSWVDFDISQGDFVGSAEMTNSGECPGSGYKSGLSKGDRCIQLKIKDGGPNDLDFSANGVVVDPGGIIEVEQPDPETSLGKAFGSIGGAGCVLSTRENDLRSHLEWILMAFGGLWMGMRGKLKKH